MSTGPLILLPPELPLVVKALTNLPHLGKGLATSPLVWPALGPPAVIVHRREVARIGPETPLEELVLAEVEKPGALLSLARRCADGGAWALLFAGPDVTREAVAEASSLSTRVVVLEYARHQLNPKWGNEVGKAAELLLWRMAHDLPFVHWHEHANRHLTAMRELDPEATIPEPAQPKKLAGAPPETLFDTFLHLHAATVEGLWWHGHQRVIDALHVCRSTLHKRLERLAPGLAAARREVVVNVSPPASAGGAPLTGRQAARAAELARARACVAGALGVIGQLALDARACDLVERLPIQTTDAAAKVWVAREVRREEGSDRRAALVLGIGRPTLHRYLEGGDDSSPDDTPPS